MNWRWVIYGCLAAALLIALVTAERPQPQPAQAPADADFERQKQNWADFLDQLAALREVFVQQPGRPLVHWRQEILKLHHLWLEVRGYPFVEYEATKRAELDAYVSGLVARVEAQNDAAERPAAP
jgi:hypothetical protein